MQLHSFCDLERERAIRFCIKAAAATDPNISPSQNCVRTAATFENYSNDEGRGKWKFPRNKPRHRRGTLICNIEVVRYNILESDKSFNKSLLSQLDEPEGYISVYSASSFLFLPLLPPTPATVEATEATEATVAMEVTVAAGMATARERLTLSPVTATGAMAVMEATVADTAATVVAATTARGLLTPRPSLRPIPAFCTEASATATEAWASDMADTATLAMPPRSSRRTPSVMAVTAAMADTGRGLLTPSLRLRLRPIPASSTVVSATATVDSVSVMADTATPAMLPQSSGRTLSVMAAMAATADTVMAVTAGKSQT